MLKRRNNLPILQVYLPRSEGQSQQTLEVSLYKDNQENLVLS